MLLVKDYDCSTRMNQQPPMHQLHQFRMSPFKPFWGWTKNTSSSAAHGFFSPSFQPQNFPLLPTSPFLPHSLHFPFTPSPKCSLELEEGEKLNIERTWRIEGKRSASCQMQNQEKKNKFPPFFAFFFLLYDFFSMRFIFCLKRRRRHRLLLSIFVFVWIEKGDDTSMSLPFFFF